MRMPEALVCCVALIMLFGGFSIPSAIEKWKGAEVAASCNNLKAAAIAASQPEPRCAK